MFDWLHHLLNPHCHECAHEKLEAREFKLQQAREDALCDSCEVLKEQLAAERYNNKELLRAVLEQNAPKQVIVNTEAQIPIQPKSVPWRVRQQMLEEEDRAKAKLMREKKTTEELEKELLGEEING